MVKSKKKSVNKKTIYGIIIGLILVALVIGVFVSIQKSSPSSLSEEELQAQAEILAEQEGTSVEEAVSIVGHALQTKKPIIIWLSCSDSDGGKNYDTKGTVSRSYSYNRKKYSSTFTDFCSTSGNYLTEYYCQGKMMSTDQKHQCPYLCTDGACSSEKIVYVSGVYGDNLQKISIMNADGTNSILLTNGPFDTQPSFSFDNTKIVFTSERDYTDRSKNEIYIMNANGGAQTRLTNMGFAIDNAPTLSPDGTKIAFASSEDGTDDIYVMNADGSNQQKLISFWDAVHDPAWSPDGTKIAFTAATSAVRNHAFTDLTQQVPDTGTDIFIMNSDGGNIVRLTSLPSIDPIYPMMEGHPAWSPDGLRIAFESGEFGEFNSEIYSINIDGTNLAKLTDNLFRDAHPSWSPDGLRIAFDSERRGAGETSGIYVMNSDGTEQIKLASGWDPSWSH